MEVRDTIRYELASREVLDDCEVEVDRQLVGDALVECQGSHYRIASGGETWEELESQARRRLGACSCGRTLCERDGHAFCRVCTHVRAQ